MNHARRELPEVDDLGSGCPALSGSSMAMQRAREAVRVAARSHARVLVSREKGCLGELVARTLHESGPWADSPFMAIECGSGDAEAVLSSLFYERDGRSAESRRVVFLDGLERMTLANQAKLAVWLGAGRLGEVAGDTWILGGTHDDLKEQVAAGRFRQDLYYHLAIVIVEIPPLRQRSTDISELLSYLARESAVAAERPVPRVPRRLVELCQHYSWPGNLRELQCVVQRLLALSTRSRLDPSALPDDIRRPRAPRQREMPFELPPEGLNLEELERHLIRQALELHGGNRTHAARALGLSRQTLLYRMQKHGFR